jgi:hypothetical protein
LDRKIKITRQPAIEENSFSGALSIFGKWFQLEESCNHYTIIIHDDYPMIEKKDVETFIEYAIGKTGCVISGCEARVHPYRLMYIDNSGFDAFHFDISQEIRGDRHLYPDVYSFVPALLGIPPKFPVDSISNYDRLDMYLLPKEKLLDRAILTEALLIRAIQDHGSNPLR